MIQQRHGFSERRACRLLGQPRSTQRRPPPPVGDEEERMRARLRALARKRPRFGYRRLTVLLSADELPGRLAGTFSWPGGYGTSFEH
jgi:putative transposase